MSNKSIRLGWKRYGNKGRTIDIKKEEFASLKGRSPLFDEGHGQPDFKKLWSHPKISMLMKQPGYRLVLRIKEKNDEIEEKQVLVYNRRNELCGKLVWTPCEGERFTLVS